MYSWCFSHILFYDLLSRMTSNKFQQFNKVEQYADKEKNTQGNKGLVTFVKILFTLDWRKIHIETCPALISSWIDW